MIDEPQEQEHDESNRDGQSARSFFALLSFLMAILLLSVFLSTPQDGLVKMVLLVVCGVFGMLGAVLLSQNRRAGQEEESEDEEVEESGEEELEQDDEEEVDETNEEVEKELTRFEQLVEEALANIPAEFQQQMENLVVVVEDEPEEGAWQQEEVGEGGLLLGLYHGVPLTAQGYSQTRLPEQITIYRRNIELICHGDEDCIREQVRRTVLHEVAHHFGMGHEEMPIWLR